MEDNINIGQEMYDWATELFPINRSITGNGVRETLQYIKNIVPELEVFEVPSGTKCFDWTIPKEWNCNDAYIIDPEGNKICNFKEHNLHLVGYSTPINQEIEYNELIKHLYYREDLPNAIPYITSYYKERWGFCITYNQFKTLKKGTYKVVIDSTLEDGHLTYGEILIKGKTEEEIFLSTYVCHPSMANNELSGPVVTTALVKFIKGLQNKKYSYRIVFIPETIGSITYLSKNLDIMKKNIIAGFNISCVGDDRDYSYLASRYGNTLSDKVARFILKDIDHKEYTFWQRGSDERQYCAPGIDLPVVTIARTLYSLYPEYHTSLDDLTVISPNGLFGAYDKLSKAIIVLEKNELYKINVLGEPQLGKRGLYPTMQQQGDALRIRNMINTVTYADGTNDLIDIANISKINYEDIITIVDQLIEAKLLNIVNKKDNII